MCQVYLLVPKIKYHGASILDIVELDDTIYAAVASQYSQGVQFIDITNPEMPISRNFS